MKNAGTAGNNIVVGLFDAAEAAGYRVQYGHMQIMLSHEFVGKIGGWNTSQRHWYISKVIARGRECLLSSHGFRSVTQSSDGHRWWQIDGEDNAQAFKAVVTALTQVPIYPSDL